MPGLLKMPKSMEVALNKGHGMKKKRGLGLLGKEGMTAGR